MKTFVGKVVALSSQQTIKVEIVMRRRHSLYKKILRKTKHYLCDGAGVACMVGDTVFIKETRPISKKKHFAVIKKV